MKPVASILFLLMIFLMAQPILLECQAMVKAEPEPVEAMCGAKSCHKAKAAKKPAEKSCSGKSKECDKTTSCNPFASCSMSPYVATSRYMYAGDQTLADSKRSYSINERTVTGFRNDCWQPPELNSFLS